MSDLTILTKQVSMTSLEIASLINSTHKDVKRSISRLIAKGAISQVPMALGEKSNNGIEPLVYVFTGEQGKRDAIVVVAQIKPEITALIVDRWLELEQQNNNVPKSYIEALELAIANEKARIALVKTNQRLHQDKEYAKLQNGKSLYGASVKQVNNKTGDVYSWRPLTKWCEDNNVIPETIYPNGYSSIETKVYPSEAWYEVYQIDLDILFGD